MKNFERSISFVLSEVVRNEVRKVRFGDVDPEPAEEDAVCVASGRRAGTARHGGLTRMVST